MIAGRYRVDRLLGRGGMADVFSAYDVVLDRPVAVKVLRAAGPEELERHRGEVTTLAKLSHPALVSLYDAGTDAQDRPYFVMELVDGVTLADCLRTGQLDGERTGAIGVALAEALAYVHARRIVHRDLKPGNVLLGTDGRTRLADFGIARVVDATRITGTGLTVGTAAYLAPEQVAGEAVGPPADVYALGLVLLECLTGSPAYDGQPVEVAMARLAKPPVVPAGRPPSWRTVLMQMTDLQP